MRRIKFYGPPGTGKTKTLLDYFNQAVLSAGAQRVLFATFTRAARQEALSRVKLSEKELPYVRTIHSLCYRLGRVQSGQLVTPSMLKQFGHRIGERLSGYEPTPDRLTLTPAEHVLMRHHYCRQRMVDFDLGMLPASVTSYYAEWLLKAYHDWKLAERLVDYTDLLTRYLESGEAAKASFAIIDEAQDLSPLQWAVVERMTKHCSTLVVAGDDDQAIFNWAGASAAQFNGFEADEVSVLKQSYRLPRTIHALAVDVITSAAQRFDKVYYPRAAEGTVVRNAVLDPVLINSAENCLILFRNHYRGQELAQELTDIGIEYVGSYHNCSKSSVELLSIHQAKGREADLVLLDPEVSRRTFEAQFASPDDEARVWYVAVTRARNELHILAPLRDSYRL